MASFDPTTHIVTATATITSTSSGITTISAITAAQLQDADMMLITPQADAYYLPGGTTVTTVLYHVLPANRTQPFSGVQTLRNLNFLRPGGTNVVATISLFKVNRDNVHL